MLGGHEAVGGGQGGRLVGQHLQCLHHGVVQHAALECGDGGQGGQRIDGRIDGLPQAFAVRGRRRDGAVAAETGEVRLVQDGHARPRRPGQHGAVLGFERLGDDVDVDVGFIARAGHDDAGGAQHAGHRAAAAARPAEHR